MTYVPPQEIIERYAHLIVQWGLTDGRGIEPGSTVRVSAQEDAKPLYFEICREVWRQGGNVIHHFMPEDDPGMNFTAAWYELASDTQLAHFSESYTRGLFGDLDYMIFILGDRNPRAAAGVDPSRRAKEAPRYAQTMAIRGAKERAGQLHWTLALWGTEAYAAEAGMSLEEYWQQIISACFLDDPDPVARWLEADARIRRYVNWLDDLDIDRLHVEAEGTDLWITLGEQRRWIGGEGDNIPSFEIFTSPDWRGTNGTISFSEPLYFNGTIVRGVQLDFRDGVVVGARAEEGLDHLQGMLSRPGADRVGEFSLTDSRLSRIDRFMAETLYDENVGGPYGNSHIAIGSAYTECYDGDEATVTQAELERLGFNVDATLHCDIVTTTDRTVTATRRDGSTQVIYADGRFQLD